MKQIFTFFFFLLLPSVLMAQVGISNIEFWDGPGHNADRVSGLGKDAFGNIYIAGHTYGDYRGNDILVVKYNAAGVKIWEKTWDGLENDDDKAYDLFVDSLGNAYVVGLTRVGVFMSRNIVTLKYDPNGNLEWESIYDLPNYDDYAKDIKVDQTGNVYVLGYTNETSGGGNDFLTLKYSPTGTLLWDAYYDGPFNTHDYARALAVDSIGNVYVTGESANVSYNRDITTVKYDSTGAEMWANHTNGTDNDSDYSNDIILDPNGYPYVTGSLRSNGSENLTTIKLNPATGNHVWQYNLNNSFSDGGEVIRYSAFDNTIVMGGFEEGGYGNFLTVKIDTSGNFIWENTFSSGNDRDILKDVGIDNLGNVYSSGWSSIPTYNQEYDINIIKYDHNGNQLWIESYDQGQNEYEGYLSVQDNNDVVMVSSVTERYKDQNIHTVRYSGTGAQVWMQRYEGKGYSDDTEPQMILDSDFNQIIIGNTDGSAVGEGDDYVILKMDSLGNLIWQTIYEHPSHGKDIVVDVVTDTANYIYVTGYTSDSTVNGNYDITTIKLNPSGDILWTHTYALPNGTNQIPCAIALDSDGNVFVAGSSDDHIYRDIVLLKYDSNGNLLGDFIYNNTAENGMDQAFDMVLDTANNVYVVGSTQLNYSINHDYLILKFDNNGTLLWEQIHAASLSKDFANNVLIDTSGDLYVGGTVWNKSSMDLVKYNDAGIQQWTLNVPDPDSLADMVIGASGNIYLTGYKSLASSFDIKTMKVSPTGNLLWLQNYNNQAGSDDKAFAIALDDSENIFVAGFQNREAVLVQYDSAGTYITNAIYQTSDIWFNKFTDVECLPSGRVLVTGEAYEENYLEPGSVTWRFNIMAASMVEGDANPRFLRVNPNTDKITIRNFGAHIIDLSDYMLASEGNQITQLSNMTIEQGSLMLSPLGEVVLSGLSLDLTGGDLALYREAPNFNNSSDMVDFMQWKNASNPYETAAVSNGFWVSGTFVDVDPAYEYIGNGTQYGEQYWEGFSAAVTMQTNAQCETNCDGSATLTVSGGTPPYTYVWDANAGNQSTATATGLCPGNYTVTVNDSDSNQTTYVVIIGVDLDLNFAPDVANESCNGGDGSIILHPNGGTGNYDVTWSIPGTDTIQNGLTAGSYTATITDLNATSCVWDTTIIIAVDAAPTINQIAGIDAICAGSCSGTATVNATGSGVLTYQWNDTNGSTTPQLNNLCPGTYTVEVSDAANCTVKDSIKIVELPLPTFNQLSTNSNALCLGDCSATATADASGAGQVSYLWNDVNNSTTPQITGLCAGTYTIQISDTNNCTNVDSVTINALPLPIINQIGLTDPTCYGDCNGSVSVSASGTGALSYLWNDPSNSTSAQVNGLCEGIYVVEVNDANCMIADTVSLVAPQELFVSDTIIDDTGLCDGKATVNVTGGTPPYSYEWNDPNVQTTATATGLCQGSYTVLITDAEACSFVDSVYVGGINSVADYQQALFNVYPNPFSDNVTVALSAVMETKVKVHDVSGRLVEEFHFYDQSYELDLRRLVKGVYIIRLETATLKGEVRVVKK